MTSKEIREKVRLLVEEPSDTAALYEIAAQLAELNERAGDGGFPIQVIGAAALDLHALAMAAAAMPRRRRY